MTGHLVVDGRFLTMQLTGVQRYATELLHHLPDRVDGDVLVAVPPGQLLDARDAEGLAAVPRSDRWHGPRGHAWEQAVLPWLVRRAGGGPLFSPASWGPAAVRRQVVLVHDLLPQLHPEYFTAGYRRMADLLTPLLVRRHIRLAATCGAVADDIARAYGVPRDRVSIIPPGVGHPFADWPDDAGDDRPAGYCMAVGAHDRRKNVRFLLDWWPKVHADLGIELIVTTRGSSNVRFSEDLGDVAGVRVVTDPSDVELAGLYAGAMFLLWPSLAEGYGLPLLEAMAVGTPFLSTATGAAPDLAVDPRQILPLEPDRWTEALGRWHEEGVAGLRRSSRAAAMRFSWDAAAAAAASALAELR